jgi:cytochrome P450
VSAWSVRRDRGTVRSSPPDRVSCRVCERPVRSLSGVRRPRTFAVAPVPSVTGETAHTPPGLPVVGNIPKLGDDPLRFLVGVQQAYGDRYPLVRLDPPGGPAVNVVLDAELVDETILFMTAGQETTALTIAYAFYWLSQHPAARERVREEAETVLGGDQPGWNDLPDLKYTERVVRETLRLTPAAWNITRETRAPTRLAGTDLAAGELLMSSTYAHHRDRRVWKDPTAFKPERWNRSASRSQDAYFPFGGGPRVCIGRQVALTEAQFALATILQAYDVTVLADELLFRPAVTLQPSTPLQARVAARD